MKLVVMTKPTYFVEEDRIISALFEEGLESLHISKTDTSSAFQERFLSLMPQEFRRKITIHQHLEMRKEFAVRGIHLESLSDKAPFAYRGIVSRTCYDVTQLREAKKDALYIFLNNVYGNGDSLIAKNGILTPALHEAKEQGLITKNVFALGDIGIEDVPIIRKLGFGGIVLRNRLWDKFCDYKDIDYSGIVNYFKQFKLALY